MLRYWIWLSALRDIGPKSKYIVLERFATPEAVYYADETAYRAVDGLSDRDIVALLDKNLHEAERILRVCTNKGIQILTQQDAAYPTRLKNIADPPLVLYYYGRLPAIDENVVIAAVGTRHASAYGMKNAKELGYQLSRAGAVVVSGAAKGIDTAALEGALTGGSPVIAVLGCGVDVVYPIVNRNLLKDICHNGCIISEYAPGTPPYSHNFPVRNRIISGLALGVLVVEAPDGSGALITARRALDQGRDVFTIPGNLGTTSMAGNFALLKEGAYLIENGADVLSQYAAQYSCILTREIKAELEEPAMVAEPVSTPKPDKKPVDKRKISNYIDLEEALKNTTPDGAALLRCLSSGEKHVDDLIDQTQIPAARVLSAITMLEIQGYVKRLPARRFSLAEEE